MFARARVSFIFAAQSSAVDTCVLRYFNASRVTRRRRMLLAARYASLIPRNSATSYVRLECNRVNSGDF